MYATLLFKQLSFVQRLKLHWRECDLSLSRMKGDHWTGRITGSGSCCCRVALGIAWWTGPVCQGINFARAAAVLIHTELTHISQSIFWVKQVLRYVATLASAVQENWTVTAIALAERMLAEGSSLNRGKLEP